MIFRKVDDGVFVAPQISVDDVRIAAAQGVRIIINNRPDGEAPDEPQGQEIERAAHDAGLDYVAIPVGHGGFSQPQVDAMVTALQGAQGKVLAYCRSGTRSTLLWSLARAKLGDAPADIREKARSAGYDLTPVDALIDMLSAHGAKNQ